MDCKKFEWKKLYGNGTYGYVHQVRRIHENETTSSEKDDFYALKITYRNQEIKGYYDFRENDMFNQLRHSCIINLVDIIKYPDVEISRRYKPKEDDMYQNEVSLLFECGKYDYYDKSPMKEEQARKPIVDLLLALEYLHMYKIVHRDIKPANIVYCEKDDKAKLIDFGFVKPGFDGCNYSPRAISLPFRPPELFYMKSDKPAKYGTEVDIWSAAITWIFFITGKMINFPNDDSKGFEAINCIADYVPNNTGADISELTTLHLSKVPTTTKNWNRFFGHRVKDISPEFWFLIERMADWNPRTRWSATMILNNNYFDKEREYINTIRSNNKIPFAFRPYIYTVIFSPERELMISECDRCMNIEMCGIDSILYKCITNRVWFHSVDTIDRYIQWRKEKNIPRPPPSVSLFRTQVILYYFYKYFSTMKECCMFSELFKSAPDNKITHNAILEWERTLSFDILKWNIYRYTAFERAQMNMDKIDFYKKEYRSGNIHNKLITPLERI